MASTTNSSSSSSNPMMGNGSYYGTLGQGYQSSGGHSSTRSIDSLPHDDEFLDSSGISSLEAEMLLKKYGKNELPDKSVPKWYIFFSLLWQPMPIMIWVAAFIELIIDNYLDMMILLIIQFANASISFYETTKAGDAVAALKASLRPEATAKRDGHFVVMDATLLVPGDLILLAAGSAVPADCRINRDMKSFVDVDQAALTGESQAVKMKAGYKCLMGSTIVRGEVEATVEYTGKDTFFGKTASLLQDEGELSNLQNILIDILVVLVLLSLALCSIVFIYLLRKTSVIEALSFTVILIVASMPLAIEIVTNTTLALGSRELSDHGAIVTRLSAVEDMAGMSILCCDKTGTLTMNKMQIQDDTPVYENGETQYSLLRYAAMATKWEEPPKDALDTLVLNAADLRSLESITLIDHIPFDPTIKRTESTVRDNTTGFTFLVSKGAPHILLKLTPNDSELVSRIERDFLNYGHRGIRCLAVAKTNEEGQWRFLGLLTFLDPPRADTKETIENARDFGVAVKMITGDHLLIAKETARRLGLGDNIQSSEVLPVLDKRSKQKPANLSENYGKLCKSADGFAQVFPELKYLIVECLREMGYKVGMTGDGVNDAPALKRADVGIAVQGSTDAARAASDIVLTECGLSTIIHGILISRCIFVRIRNFITYRIAATLQVLLFFFVAVFLFQPSDYQPVDNPDPIDWPSYFFMPVLLLMLITVLNDGTLISIAYDDAMPSDVPEKWNLEVLFCIGGVLGTIGCISSLFLLWILLDSWNENGVFGRLGIPGLSYGQIMLGIYMSVSITTFLTLFSARTGESYFFSSAPSSTLLAASLLALTVSTILACVWPAGYLDGVYILGLEYRAPYYLPVLIWCHCLLWWLLQDFCKVQVFKLLRRYDLFGINDSGCAVENTRQIDEGNNLDVESQRLLL